MHLIYIRIEKRTLNTLFENIVYFFKKPDRDDELESKYINEVSRKNIKAIGR